MRNAFFSLFLTVFAHSTYASCFSELAIHPIAQELYRPLFDSQQDVRELTRRLERTIRTLPGMDYFKAIRVKEYRTQGGKTPDVVFQVDTHDTLPDGTPVQFAMYAETGSDAPSRIVTHWYDIKTVGMINVFAPDVDFYEHGQLSSEQIAEYSQAIQRALTNIDRHFLQFLHPDFVNQFDLENAVGNGLANDGRSESWIVPMLLRSARFRLSPDPRGRMN